MICALNSRRRLASRPQEGGWHLSRKFRANLLTLVQRGVPFDRTTGLPEPMLREMRTCPWFDHSCRYVDMKWPAVAPGQRKSIAEALATVTPALVVTTRGKPLADLLRRALYGWAFVTPARDRPGTGRRQHGRPQARRALQRDQVRRGAGAVGLQPD